MKKFTLLTLTLAIGSQTTEMQASAALRMLGARTGSLAALKSVAAKSTATQAIRTFHQTPPALKNLDRDKMITELKKIEKSVKTTQNKYDENIKDLEKEYSKIAGISWLTPPQKEPALKILQNEIDKNKKAKKKALDDFRQRENSLKKSMCEEIEKAINILTTNPELFEDEIKALRELKNSPHTALELYTKSIEINEVIKFKTIKLPLLEQGRTFLTLVSVNSVIITMLYKLNNVYITL